MTSNNQKRRGKKRRQYSSSDSDTSTNDVIEKKPSSRPGTPKAGVAAPGDDIARTNPKAGWPASSSKRKAENEADTKMISSSPCKCDKCKSGPDRFSGILKNKLERYPSKTRVGYDAPRGKGKEVFKKYYASDTSISAGNSLTERERKRAKRALKGSVTDDSYVSLLMKVLEASSNLEVPNNSKQITKPILKQSSKRSSKQSLKQRGQSKSPDTRSIDSRSTYSGKSSGRSSVRSLESMDGQTELLESLVHAAHAEDKLRREKQELRNEVQKRKKINDELEQELLYALKVVDELSSKYKSASKDSHNMEHKLHTLKQEYILLAKDRDKSAPALKDECCICFEEMEISSSSKNKGKRSGGKQLKQRACFRPCNHGGACFECAVSVWEKTNQCPFCGIKLSEKPTVVHN